MGVKIHKRKRTIPNSFEYPYFQTVDKLLTRLQKDRGLWVGTDLTATAAILCTDFESHKPVVLYINNRQKYKAFYEYEFGCLAELQDEKLEKTLDAILQEVSRTYIIQINNMSGLFIASEREMSVFIMQEKKQSLMKYMPSIAEINPFDTVTELYHELNKVNDMDNVDMESLIDKIKSIWLINELRN